MLTPKPHIQAPPPRLDLPGLIPPDPTLTLKGKVADGDSLSLHIIPATSSNLPPKTYSMLHQALSPASSPNT